MGLLDGLLGQVLGGMAQGGRDGGFRLPGGATDGLPIPGGAFGRGGAATGGAGGLGSAGLGVLLMLGLQLLQRNGGIEGVLGKLRDTGHQREADSWVGSGANEPIAPDALADALGRDQIDDLARQLGVDGNQALGGLANLLPEIVNEITPGGRVQSDSDDVVEEALRRLRERG
jgi:uncharacterized protein YidB (DUF937 family)